MLDKEAVFKVVQIFIKNIQFYGARGADNEAMV